MSAQILRILHQALFKIDAVPVGTATDLRSLHKYMDVYSRPPDRSVGRY